MKVVKVRRVGNSNVICLPRELEKLGYTAGIEVVVYELESGELRVMPAGVARSRIREIARRVVEEDREALDILARHDREGADTAARQ